MQKKQQPVKLPIDDECVELSVREFRKAGDKGVSKLIKTPSWWIATF